MLCKRVSICFLDVTDIVDDDVVDLFGGKKSKSSNTLSQSILVIHFMMWLLFIHRTVTWDDMKSMRSIHRHESLAPES